EPSVRPAPRLMAGREEREAAQAGDRHFGGVGGAVPRAVRVLRLLQILECSLDRPLRGGSAEVLGGWGLGVGSWGPTARRGARRAGEQDAADSDQQSGLAAQETRNGIGAPTPAPQLPTPNSQTLPHLPRSESAW